MLCKKCKSKIPDDSVFCCFCGKKQIKELGTQRPAKRPNGSGTIIDYGERAKLRYGARVTAGFIDGKQTYKYIGRWKTKKEARTYLDLYAEGMYAPPSDLTLREIYDEWSCIHFKHISKQLQANYRTSFAKLSSLHNQKFVSLRSTHYQEIVDALDQSISSKRKIKVLIGLLYKHAMENDICAKNYAQFIRVDSEQKKEKEIFSDSEIKMLWESRPESDSILVLIYTGFRIQELLNLKKSDVDIENMIIKGGLKTDAGKDRVVPINSKIQPIIKHLYHNSTDRIFTKGENKPITPDYYRKYIYFPLLEKLNISRKTPHSTRHTFASLLARSGASTNEIKNLMGHSNYAFTADVYTHVDVDGLRNAISGI